jgi:hypothetical protein
MTPADRARLPVPGLDEPAASREGAMCESGVSHRIHHRLHPRLSRPGVQSQKLLSSRAVSPGSLH